MRSFTAVVALSALSMVAAQNSTAFTITLTDVPETTRSKSSAQLQPVHAVEVDPFLSATCQLLTASDQHRQLVHRSGEHLWYPLQR